MNNTKPQDKKPATVKVKLTKPHTHAGKDFHAGDELEVDQCTAEWLRQNGVVAAEANQA